MPSVTTVCKYLGSGDRKILFSWESYCPPITAPQPEVCWLLSMSQEAKSLLATQGLFHGRSKAVYFGEQSTHRG